MKQQQFEELLFSGRELTAEEQQALQAYVDEHSEQLVLQQGWGAVEGLLHAAQNVAPRPGFSGRWEARWQQRRDQAARRQALGVSLASAAAALALLAYFYLRAPFGLSEIKRALFVFSGELVEMLAFLQIALRVTLSILAKITPAGWLAIGFAIVVLPLVWWSLFRELAPAKGASQ